MNTLDRIRGYQQQNGTDRLTPAQRRRVRKKQNHRVLAGDLPQGRLRRRHDAKDHREVKGRARQWVSAIRAARAAGGWRKLTQKTNEDR